MNSYPEIIEIKLLTINLKLESLANSTNFQSLLYNNKNENKIKFNLKIKKIGHGM